MLDWTLFGALALASAVIARLALMLRRESAGRALVESALEAGALRSAQLAMLDRRLKAIAPLDALWLGWSSEGRPPAPAIAGALAALAEARLVFPGEIEAALEELSALLLAYRGHQAEVAAAREDGSGRSRREEMLEREIAIEQALRPKLAALRERLGAAARVPDA
jgi:hypothetical protein